MGPLLDGLDAERVSADVVALLGERLQGRELNPDQTLVLESALTYELALALEEAFDVELSPAEVARARRVADWTNMVQSALSVDEPALDGRAPWLRTIDDGPASERISVY